MESHNGILILSKIALREAFGKIDCVKFSKILL